jgi:hypothetical protein
MAIIISAVRAYLLSDAQDKPLPSPQGLDLAKGSIPYGARVRFEVDIEGGEGIYTPWLAAFANGTGGRLPMFRVGDSNTFRAEGRMPLALLFWAGEAEGQSAPLRFPLADWPPFGGGDYLLYIAPEALDGSAVEPVEIPFKIGAPPAKGGSAPRITALAGPAGNSLLLGQPWLMTAKVEDAENDVLAVVFSTYRAGFTRWWFMFDDGSHGDAKAGDGIYSLLRVGGDAFDLGEKGELGCRTVKVSAQAVDLRGNWSEPVMLEYELKYGQEPVWMNDPNGGPNVTEINTSRPAGTFDLPLITAQCDSDKAWMCAQVIGIPDIVIPLFPDSTSGKHSNSIVYSSQRHWDVVGYAVSKEGALSIGQKMAAVCPPNFDQRSN